MLNELVIGGPGVAELLPWGISVVGVLCVIGPGVVVDPLGLVEEIDGVRAKGIEVDTNFLIDVGAHMVMPYHMAVEAAEEESRGGSAIGTTRKGIGPAYADRYSREGLPIGMLASFGDFEGRLRKIAARKNEILTKLHGAEPLDVDAMVADMRRAAERLVPHLADTPELIRETLASGANVIFEGAQGTLLDISFGTYPFVTSSHTSAAGVAPGTGVPPSMLGDVIGVAKAYITRVGAGPFPTEALDDLGETIRERGKERGATTGRPRRCGWLDIVARRYAIGINGIDRLIITKLDVLDAFETIPICVGYRIGATETDRFPRSAEELARVEPIYEEMPGWKADTTAARKGHDLPREAMAYLRRIEELTGVPVAAASVGAAAHAVVQFAEIL